MDAIKKPAPTPKKVAEPEAAEEPSATISEPKSKEAEAIPPTSTQDTEAKPSTETDKADTPENETLKTQYTKLSGPKKTVKPSILMRSIKKKKRLKMPASVNVSG